MPTPSLRNALFLGILPLLFFAWKWKGERLLKSPECPSEVLVNPSSSFFSFYIFYYRLYSLSFFFSSYYSFFLKIYSICWIFLRSLPIGSLELSRPFEPSNPFLNTFLPRFSPPDSFSLAFNVFCFSSDIILFSDILKNYINTKLFNIFEPL